VRGKKGLVVVEIGKLFRKQTALGAPEDGCRQERHHVFLISKCTAQMMTPSITNY